MKHKGFIEGRENSYTHYLHIAKEYDTNLISYSEKYAII